MGDGDEAELTGKAEIKEVEFLTVGKAFKSIICSTQSLDLL